MVGSGSEGRSQALAEELVGFMKAANSTEIVPWKTHGVYGMAEEQWERTEM